MYFLFLAFFEFQPAKILPLLLEPRPTPHLQRRVSDSEFDLGKFAGSFNMQGIRLASTTTIEDTQTMFDQNDQAGISANLMAFQNRCAQGLGSMGTNADVFVQLAVTSPSQPQPQVISAGNAVNSIAAHSAVSAFVTESFAYDSLDKLLAGLGTIVEQSFDLLNDPNASLTGTIQVTPIYWGGTRGPGMNHSMQVVMANGQVWLKHIETTV